MKYFLVDDSCQTFLQLKNTGRMNACVVSTSGSCGSWSSPWMITYARETRRDIKIVETKSLSLYVSSANAQLSGIWRNSGMFVAERHTDKLSCGNIQRYVEWTK